MIPTVTILGAGLAGSEAAWQLAEAGVRVRLIEMKPERRTPAQVSDNCAELVCSNSLRSSNVQNAVGLIKEEMRRLGSLIIGTAIAHRVPAGDALAVDRVAFSAAVTEVLDRHPNITRISAVATRLPGAQEGPCIVATGPLTDTELAADIGRTTGAERLYFYDAIAPIVSRDSLDERVVFAASRYGKGDGADYLNCPMDREAYDRFLDALLAAECMPLHAFEEPKYFQGCLPVEVIAKSGRDALRYGPMKPVGLDDPRTGRWPYAVVQLRREDVGGQAFNLVGFQTKLKYPEQKRVLRLIPGLEEVEILRYGAIHRNTYLDSPTLLDARMRLTRAPHLRFAGQITGVEGYVESAAHGLVTALLLASDLTEQPVAPPPPECALGALFDHVRGVHRMPGRPHEPQNVNWSMFPPPPSGVRKHAAKAYR
ncbi:MAG TPA: methylenetetrahydrofolate--tRNA-(uracil(54)-C(5))-methyltransferase (FADH(2)-oxidizing) TrmFO, partial [Myxococcota bacterium]|nr:methylenetetrahydrofolate--tRNA-(uracil(54)-C(5))-methyltransferase (FADH(2)-oxidizing) TrmFO [Myxococcota bacterium]